MSLTLNDIARVATLSRLELSEAETAATQHQLNNIFGLIETMQAVDTRNVEPMAHAQDMAQRLRADEISEENQREAFQAIAPETEAGLYLVPKVIE